MILFERSLSTVRPQPSPTGQNDAARVIRLELTGPQSSGVVDTLHYCLDERSTLVRGSDWWVYASTPVGLDCFPALTRLLTRGQTDGLDSILEGLEELRPVAYVAGCQRRGTLHFGRSLDGFTSLLFGHDNQRLVISDSRVEVAQRMGEIRLSQRDKQHCCRNFMLEPEGSFYENVKRCFAGVCYHVSARHLAPDQRRFMAPASQVRKEADPVQILTDGLRQLFSTYGNRKIALRLSGGADSRVLLVGLMDAVRQGILHRDQVLCTGVSFPGFQCDEGAVIHRIVELSGFESTIIPATAELARRAQQKRMNLPTPPFPTSFIGALCMEEIQRREASLMLTGHGGDEVFTFNLSDILGRSLAQRLRSHDLIRWLRQARGWRAEAKALLASALGRHSQRGLIQQIKANQLPADSLAAWRLAYRLTLAQACGYENAAAASHAHGLLLDVPFFRGPFFPQLDPARGIHQRRFPYKANAHRYLQAYAPDIAAVPCEKLLFGDAVDAFFPPPTTAERDAVDTHPAHTYHFARGYANWSTPFLQTGRNSP
ncbi:asparagine synthase-related protein [Denitratimonas sp. CY0512]|uniref:asparagine synthase-related protein n=1 Tax=Denitratimonas sp. CY0512 TaxID=3131940 RepID=UPI0030A109DF